MSDRKERWRPVRGCEGLYEVSNLGRVRTVPQILKSYPAKKGGHHQINLGARRRTYVHRLVAEAFLDPPDVPERRWVNHKDGNPSNNALSNLEWSTPGENIAHGYQVNGRKHYAEVRVAAVSKDGEILAEFDSMTKAAKWAGVTVSHISGALRRKGTSAGFRWERLV